MRPWLLVILMLGPLSAVRPVWAQTDTEGLGAVPAAAPLESNTERGPVSARVTLEPAQPLIGDPLTLRLAVTAEPGVELIMPEFGQSLDRFSIREFVPREKIDESGRTLATQRYVLSTPISGPQYIPPIAIEFVDRRAGMRPAPDGEDAYEILTERLDFEVKSVLPESGSEELEPPLGKLPPIATGTAARGLGWLLVLALLIGLTAVLGAGFFLHKRVGKPRASAYQIAQTRLDALKAHHRPKGPEAVNAFFVELSDLVRRYLEDHFGLHAPELTTEEFLDVAAGSPDLSTAHQGFLQDFLRRADQVKFARHLPEAEYIEEVLLAAGRFLEQTREQPASAAATPGETAAHA